METQQRIVKLFGEDGFSAWRYQPASVSVGWRIGAHGQPKLCLSLNTRLMRKLGWLGKDRVSYRMDYESNKIIVIRSASGSGYVRGHARRGVVEIAMQGMNFTAMRPAKPAKHTVKAGEVLVIDMPTWMARTVPVQVAAQPKPIAPPKPPAAPKAPYVGVMAMPDPAAVARARR